MNKLNLEEFLYVMRIGIPLSIMIGIVTWVVLSLVVWDSATPVVSVFTEIKVKSALLEIQLDGRQKEIMSELTGKHE